VSRPRSLRSRIRNYLLVLVASVAMLGLYALPRVHHLGGAIRATLYRNYVSIEAAQHMHAALARLELAERDGRASGALADSASDFMHWMNVENHDLTEVGEPKLAGDIESGARRLFAEVQTAMPGVRHDQEFADLHRRLDELIEMNRTAMFRADSRAMTLSRRLTYEFAAGLMVLLLAGTVLAWGVGRTLSKPLDELAERLRGISQRRTHVRLGAQHLAELDEVAQAFNYMAEQLERYEKLNVERLLYEKNKTEAIIESLEDGVVLLSTDGTVTHINEIAAIIIGIDRGEALGSPFDDLSCNHPHYFRVRDALRKLVRANEQIQRVEVQLHMRGRDHSYLLKPIALRSGQGSSFGTLLILQDVTYVRDQDRARTNLVATLSHELRTPLTSIGVSADLLSRDALDPRRRELVIAILDECTRMKQLTDNLLNLARGELASIALKRERLDVSRLVREAVARFGVQAREKQIKLEGQADESAEMNGDAVKLSWVISNLIGNALRYTPAEGKIVVRAQRDDGHLRLNVSDSGPGIPPEVRQHIFERFAQYGIKDRQRGAAGLGLAIVKEIVEAHGGRIFVDSAEGYGTTFSVELPLSEQEIQPAA
jgi:two-component system, NtrC family, sensor histidine kinase KinB